MSSILANTLKSIEQSAGQVDNVAGGILSAIREQDARTIEHFNEMVSEAYAANGWTQTRGRPLPGAAGLPAPDAVRVYISTARAGYRMKLDMVSIETMGSLRSAIRDKRKSLPHAQDQKPPELKGVSVSRVNALTGALLHDVLVVREHLPEKDQAAFDAQLRKLLDRYTKKADIAA